MPLITKAYTFQNGVASDAIQVNQDMDTLYNLINGLLDAVNIAAAGLNDPNKFASEVITQAKSKGLVYTQDLYGQSWVVSGGVTTASGSPANQITVTTLIANILQVDGSYRHVTVGGATYVTSIINATYFLELQPDGTMNWSQTHSVQANYMPIATVTSNASGNINVITDNRVTALLLKAPSVKTPNNTLDDGSGNAIIAGNLQANGTTYPKVTSGAIAQGTGGLGGINVRANNPAGNAAFMTFERQGFFGAYFGLDTDNAWRVGGYSYGAISYELFHDGNVGTKFANSKVTNGYQKLPNGLILQWGVAGSVPTGSGGTTVTFPIAFPTACLNATLTVNAGLTGVTASVYSISAPSMIIAHSYTGNLNLYYFAIGY